MMIFTLLSVNFFYFFQKVIFSDVNFELTLQVMMASGFPDIHGGKQCRARHDNGDRHPQPSHPTFQRNDRAFLRPSNSSPGPILPHGQGSKSTPIQGEEEDSKV